MGDVLKELVWLGNSKKKLRAFPEKVKDVMGFALHLAQAGDKHPAAKPFKGYGSGVLEVVDDYDGDTFRAVYTVRFGDVVYVPHAFRKKAKKRIATPQQDVDLIKRRLKAAESTFKKRK